MRAETKAFEFSHKLEINWAQICVNMKRELLNKSQVQIRSQNLSLEISIFL